MEKISSLFLGPTKRTEHFVYRHSGHLVPISLDPVPAHQFPVRDQKTVFWAEEMQGRP